MTYTSYAPIAQPVFLFSILDQITLEILERVKRTNQKKKTQNTDQNLCLNKQWASMCMP